MIRACIRKHMEESDDASSFEALLNAVGGNTGFIFCHGDMDEIRKICTDNKVDAAAKAGVMAPCDVKLPMGPTGLDPSSTNFFQVLNIPTKIVKGSKVSASQAVLLTKMGIKPFSYAMKVTQVFDQGSVFDAAVLDITDAKVMTMFMGGVANVAALSREIGVPTEASLPHAVSAGLKNM